MARSITSRLLAAQANGAIIVCDCPPYRDEPMAHLPRYDRDGQPWVLESQRSAAYPLRYTGGECKAIVPGGQEAPAPARKLRPLGEHQEAVLDSLRRHGVYPGMWYYENHSGTVRILESLVRRGLVETFDVPSRYLSGSPTTHYRLVTEAPSE
jgi:hypothetical protein